MQCCTITLLHINSLNKTESAIFISLICSLVPEDLHSKLIFKQELGGIRANKETSAEHVM